MVWGWVWGEERTALEGLGGGGRGGCPAAFRLAIGE